MHNLAVLLTLLSFGTLVLGSGPAEASGIIGISSPADSDDNQSHPNDDNVWSVNAPPFPFNTSSGIGYIINPAYPTDPTLAVPTEFSRHDHVYSAAHIPDPTRAVVTYQFNMPTAVDQLEIIQHRNGITMVEGFVGNSLGSLSSIGTIFGPSGDNTTFNGLTEGSSAVFDFDNAVAGTYFQFIVRKTNASDGWATYRAFPRLSDGTRISPAVPEPATSALFMSAIVACTALLRRNRT
jgi:hypothetical protein